MDRKEKKVDFIFLSAVFRKCKNIFSKMLVFCVSLALILILAFVLTMGNMYLSILSFVIFFVVFIPLFLSFELVSMRLLTGHEVNYNEIYKNYKAYYAPVFRGCYGLIFTCFLTFIVADLLLSGYISLLAASNTTLFEEFLNTQDVNIFLNIPYFSLGLIVVLGLCILFFGYRILSKVNIPYFNFYFGLPTPATKRIAKTVKRRARASYQKQVRTVSLPMLLIFILLYFPLGIGLYFVMDAGYALIIASCVSILGCAIYFPIFISGNFLAFYTHRGLVMRLIQEEIRADLEHLEKMDNVPEEEKAKYRALFDAFNKKAEDEMKKNLDQNSDDDLDLSDDDEKESDDSDDEE